MSEAALWKALRSRLSKHGEMYRVENPIIPGTPDVHYALRVDNCPGMRGQGWIELKYTPSLPARETTPVRYGWRPGQRAFLGRYWDLGGHAYVLAQVGREYLLHSGIAAAELGVGVSMTMNQLREISMLHWAQPWGDDPTWGLLAVLTAPR